MFRQYIGDINEFPALNSSASSPQQPNKRTYNKQTYASTTASGTHVDNTSNFSNNHGLNTIANTNNTSNPDILQARLSSASKDNNKRSNFDYSSAANNHMKKEAWTRYNLKSSSQKVTRIDLSQFNNEQPLQLGHDNDIIYKSPPPQTQTNYEEQQYGLMGLLGVLRMINADQSMLALGSDLSTLGLNLNTSNTLYSTFISPWLDTQIAPPGVTIEPGFYLPNCYQDASASPSAYERMDVFSDEILFYTFYSMSQDTSQNAAARELRKRNWRYCKNLGLWVTRDTSQQQQLFNRPASGESSEHGVFEFFDPALWRRVEKEWIIQWDEMEEQEEEQEEKIIPATLPLPSQSD